MDEGLIDVVPCLGRIGLQSVGLIARRLFVKFIRLTEEQYQRLAPSKVERTESQAKAMGMNPIVPPNKSRKAPWKCDKELYRKRNEAEGLFLRLKGNRLSLLPFGQVGCEIHGLHNIRSHLQHAPLVSTHSSLMTWVDLGVFFLRSKTNSISLMPVLPEKNARSES